MTLDWRSNVSLFDSIENMYRYSFVQNSPNRFHENMIILITDGPPCNFFNERCYGNTRDLWQLSNELEDKKIKLIVIGIEPCILECDDFYCALSQNTGLTTLFILGKTIFFCDEYLGGEYIPFVNASRILSTVLPQVIYGEDTIRQAFRHIDMNEFERNSFYNYRLTQQRVRPMIKYCRTMAEIRDQFYTYRSRVNQSDMNVFIDDDDDDGELCTPPWNWTDFERSFSQWAIFTSTPTTDDEGYRTRLPTTASADSSFMCFPDLALIESNAAIDIDSNSDIDDHSI